MANRMMRCLLVCMVLGALPRSLAAEHKLPDAVMGDPVRMLLAAETNYTVVQITFPVQTAPREWSTAERIEWSGIVTEVHCPDTGQAEPVTAAYGMHVAITGMAVPTWRVAAVQWYRQPREPAAPVVDVGIPIIYRGVSLVPLQVFVEAGGGILAGLVLEVQHPTLPDLAKNLADPSTRQHAAKETVPGSLVNPDHFRDLRVWSQSRQSTAKSTPLPDPFALTQNWLRIAVTEIGIYSVTGQQLEQSGLNLSQIHPATLRLFKGGGLALDLDPTLPDSEQAERIGLTEVAIDVQVSVDGDFQADDRLLFYGFGTDVWLDRLVPDDPDAIPEDHDERMAYFLRHYNHPFQDYGVYWLTWEAQAKASPFDEPALRIGPPREAIPTGADTDMITTHRARHHGEVNGIYLGGLVRDNWVWINNISTSEYETMILHGVVLNAPAYWQVDICGVQTSSWIAQAREMETTIRINNDVDGQVTRTWRMTIDQAGQEQVRISGMTTALRELNNTIRLWNDNFAITSNPIALDSFDFLYHATLDKNDYPGALTSVFWGDEVNEQAVSHQVHYILPVVGQMWLWDVTVPNEVFALAGNETAGPPRTLTVQLHRNPGQTRHLMLFGESDLLSVASVVRQRVRPLRQDIPAADYIVIHPMAFREAAEDLAELRSRVLPGVELPKAIAVSVEDIYANFSGGQKDWRAIRQFLRWHFYDLEDGDRLMWVCLLGNASRDYRNYQGHNLFDWVPTDIVTVFPALYQTATLNHPFASDGSLAALDAPTNPYIGVDVPDLAVGRMPANSPAEALAMVKRMKDYVDEPPPGRWRNHITFSADDLVKSGSITDRAHMDQAERLAAGYIPRSLEIDKVYLDDFPFVGQYKPTAQRALLSSLNAGTTMFYYVGHGAGQQLADEQLFLTDFIPGLTNSGRRFLFIAFSCDVGVFDDYGSRSMAELFLLPDMGGAIASIAASYVSLSYLNNALSNAFFATLYPQPPQPLVHPTVTVGQALLSAQISAWIELSSVRNARRYNMFGDPALRLVNPVADLPFAYNSADSLLSGRLHKVRIDHSGSSMPLGPGLEYQLLVQESGSEVPYSTESLSYLTWRRPGSRVFQGTGSIPDGEAGIPFLAPLYMRTGDDGRIRLLVNDGQESRVAFLQVPVVQTTVGAGQDVHGPEIRMAFTGGRLRVQAGAELYATLFDTSGISILATNPVNSVLMEFNDSGLYSNVSSDVIFDPGSYTRASLATNLPQDLALGQHQVVMTASDMFGNVGSDTLRFYLEASGVAAIRDAVVFPNPTTGYCRLVCDLSVPMDLRWDIYTVSGRRIRSIRESPVTAGPVILKWDGRDGEGDTIANGVYLYVLRGTIPGSGHELRETGQIVIMR